MLSCSKKCLSRSVKCACMPKNPTVELSGELVCVLPLLLCPKNLEWGKFRDIDKQTVFSTNVSGYSDDFE